jgi:hypothetical protein
MSHKNKTALVHKGAKQTLLHEQTSAQKQTHPTQHTTILNRLGEEIETSHRYLRRHHQHCVTAKPQSAAGPNNP